ncbi:hypothetical protein [Sphingobacterium haloxyli]|uniref:Uncharacterized protein n=1 Tax=Sphingobacterium haloxyli TaxID=2100533 RepID=A0A2S9J857_9SPHI|nr:hypothetical protein [Sphingobacterium haloxyli]PRD48919.1 hypothetical protein C5745_03000 [Sphingobacterium haloxyli]
MKKLLFPYFLLSLLALFSCSKEQEYLENEKVSELSERLQGEWISVEPAEDYFKVVFQKDNLLRYYIGIGTEHENLHYTAPYQLMVENETILRIRRSYHPSGQKADFNHQIYFEGDLLRVKNLQKDLTQVDGNYPGDVSVGYHDVVFEREN